MSHVSFVACRVGSFRGSAQRSRRFWLRLAFAILAGICALLASPGGAKAASPEEVDGAVARGVAYLRSQQNNSNWETKQNPDWSRLDPKGGYSEVSYFGALTSLSTYALVSAGEREDAPEINKAIHWLMDADLRGTYAVGMRAQLWPLIRRSKERDAVRDRDKDFLLRSLIRIGPNIGFYGYSYGSGETKGIFPLGGPKMADAWYDRGNSRFGVLGVWGLEQAGAEIPHEYWESIDKAWKAAQANDGGWNYSGGQPDWAAVNVTMTSAAVATLVITQDYMLKGKSWERCTGGIINDHIESGLKYMDKHINEAIAGGSYDAMYGVERISAASGRKYFGMVDWYKNGAQYLVSNQKPDGSWIGANGAISDTSFALLFLARGRAPVMMNKLEYAIAGKAGNNAKAIENPWNERPRDAANLAKWAAVAIGGRAENKYLNWQIVNLKVSVDDLHDAPILYISGADELKFSEEEIGKLRQYVEQGGMILGNADCSSEKFSKSFEKLGTTLFSKYAFREIPTDHLIYTGEQYDTRKWRIQPRLRGLSNGVRELVLLLPDMDVGRDWQSDLRRTRQESFELAANIFLYSGDKRNLQTKGDTYIVHANSTPSSKHVKIARIQTDGNWDPEPAGWPRLSAIMHNSNGIDLDVAAVKLGSGKLADYKIASLTGTPKFKLDDAQKKELKDFVAKGGTLIVDAAGGSSDFAESAESELPIIFGADANKGLGTPLPPSSPVFSAGAKISEVGYRAYARPTMTDKVNTPRLKGITIDGRLAVFYSREDLSAGLVGEQVDGIVGYDPKSAVDLMSNLILYASGNAAPVAAAAADAYESDANVTPLAETLVPPDSAAEAKAAELVKETYSPYPTDPGERQALATQFIDEARTPKDDNATRYVLLREARTIAEQTDRFALALKAVAATHDIFGINMVPDELELLKKAVAQKRPAVPPRSLFLAATSVSKQAAAAENFDGAVTAADYAEKLAIASNDDLMAKDAHALLEHMLAFQREQKVIRPIEDELAKSPDDARANLQMGKFLCLRKGNWASGLPYLAKGDDAAMSAAASSELENARTGDATFDVAGAWWKVAGRTADDNDASAIRGHARQLYSQAAPKLSGVKRTLAEKRAKADGD